MHCSNSLRNCLNYNEQKVQAGLAKCLEAGYYPMDAAEMSFYQKLLRLEKLTTLNQRAKVNSIHFSLNFHPSENPSESLLKEIAEVFLEKIGFAGQPYLLYQHFDAGHPHIHLVTTQIKPDGTAIILHNLGRIQVKKAREELEIAYGLIRATGRREREADQLKPVAIRRVLYGRMETKGAIEQALDSVIKNYQFSSLQQLNNVLGLYNVTADPGSEGSRIRKYDGLVYRVLDEQGNKIGVPIRASDFSGKPTLKNLRIKFAEKDAQKLPEDRTRIRNAVDLALLSGQMDLPELGKKLKQSGIDMLIRQNAQGLICGITYVDHQRKTVFNGSELGMAYSAKATLERCAKSQAGEEKNSPGEREKPRQSRAAETGPCSVDANQGFAPGAENSRRLELVDILLDPGYQPQVMDWQLKRSKKKRKRKRLLPD